MLAIDRRMLALEKRVRQPRFRRADPRHIGRGRSSRSLRSRGSSGRAAHGADMALGALDAAGRPAPAARSGHHGSPPRRVRRRWRCSSMPSRGSRRREEVCARPAGTAGIDQLWRNLSWNRDVPGDLRRWKNAVGGAGPAPGAEKRRPERRRSWEESGLLRDLREPVTGLVIGAQIQFLDPVARGPGDRLLM